MKKIIIPLTKTCFQEVESLFPSKERIEAKKLGAFRHTIKTLNLKSYFMKSLLFYFLLFFVQFAQAQNQTELLQSYTDRKVYALYNDLSTGDKPRELKILRDANQNITSITIQYVLGTKEFKPIKIDEKYNIIPFFREGGVDCITYLDGIFYEYYLDERDIENIGLGKSKITRFDAFYTDDRAKFKQIKKNLEEYKQKLNDYLQKMINEVKSLKEKEEAEKKAMMEAALKARQEENMRKSIQGKDIVKIEIVWLTKETETALGYDIKYGIRATDKNGQVFETRGLNKDGLWEVDDYNLTTDCECSLKGTGLEVPIFVNSIKNDRITLTVQSKYHPNLKPVSSSIKMSYSKPLEIYYSGGTSSNGSGIDKYPLKIYVSESANKKFNLIQIVTYNGNKENIKLQKGVYLTIHNEGTKGEGESKRRPAGRGGHGGDVSIYYSPNVKIDFITIMNKGGRSGRGGVIDGRDGKIEKFPQAVNLNF